MSIRMSVGNIGSGKSVCEVRKMYMLKGHRKIYSNIITKLPNQINIKQSMFIKKQLVKEIRKKDGTIEPVYKTSLNIDFWKNRPPEPISIIIDEAHTLYGSRNSMSLQSRYFSEFLAMGRRFLSSTPSDIGGELVFITQVPRKIDVNVRDLCTSVHHHRCYYNKICLNKRCGTQWRETSDDPEPMYMCPRCGGFKLSKGNYIIEVWHFANVEKYDAFIEVGARTYHHHYYITDIEKYFPLYNTLQMEDLFSEEFNES